MKIALIKSPGFISKSLGRNKLVAISRYIKVVFYRLLIQLLRFPFEFLEGHFNSANKTSV
ncbi:hypothetical protein SAMN05428975_0644 [Mucilaginibacter sp. OK268]|nr:hypothetical protein SAMN05428975_0644 [Mucilaginibacter sp. OK268]